MNVSEAELSSNKFMTVIPIFFHHKTNKKRNNTLVRRLEHAISYLSN